MEIYSGRAVVFLTAVLLLLAGPAAAQDISGQVRIEPPYPEAKIIKVKKKVQDSCADEQISKALLVSPEGGVANAVVWLEGKFETAPEAEKTAVLDQKSCNFVPHIVLVPPGNKLRILNSDPLAHDVRAFEEAVMLFRLDMGEQGQEEIQSFKKPGIYTLRCGLHPWMHGFAVHAAHAHYAVTDENGQFRLPDVPEGKQTIHLWHETLGEVQVPWEPGQDFSYTFSQKKP